MFPLRPSVRSSSGNCGKPKRGFHVGHVVLVARRKNFIARSVTGESRPRTGGHAVVRQQLHLFNKGSVAADDHAAVAGRDALRGIEAEASGIAQQAGFAAAIGSFNSVSAVFDDLEVVALGKLEDWVHLAGASAHVDGDEALVRGVMRALDGVGCDIS